MLRVFLKKKDHTDLLSSVLVRRYYFSLCGFVYRRDKTYKRAYEAESKIAKDARPRWS